MRWLLSAALWVGVGGCSPPASPVTCDITADCDSGRICQVGLCVDLRPMPDTGVTECAIFGPCPQALAPGQDAEFGPNIKTFEVSASGETLRDLDSTLIWQRGSSSEPLGYDDAVDHCERLRLDGYRNWRLPDTFELYTLIDFSLTGPMIVGGFEDTNTELPYWSIDRPGPDDRATLVSFQDARVIRRLPEGRAPVRCVQGTAPVRPTRLESTAVEAPWKDSSTGLEWSERMFPQGQWQHSLTHCSWLDLEGTGWRLPNILETLTLANHATQDDFWAYREISGSRWWWGSSTAEAGSGGLIWSVHMGDGSVEPRYWNSDARPHYRCVRDL